MIFLPSTPPLAQPRPEITLSVDAREAARDLFHVEEKIPVRAGILDLVYPKWLPGDHAPTGPLNSVFNFSIEAGGNSLPWERDALEPYTLHLSIPSGVETITVRFDQSGKSANAEEGSANLSRIKWNRLIWYPASPSDSLVVRTQIQLPTGWGAATALTQAGQTGDTWSYNPVTLTKLVDSPVLAGLYGKRFDVSGRSQTKHFLDVFTEGTQPLAWFESADGKALLSNVARLHEEAETMISSNHYGHYDWLLSLSDEGGSDGLEHHESSEDGVPENGVSDDAQRHDLADLLAHEYFHSFNGKFRRPEGLATPNYQAPMRDDLLWVYEGLTQFYGKVLATRAGFWTPEFFREDLAAIYDQQAQRKGRNWRPLVDTATSAFRLGDAGMAWSNARRSLDYYDEMVLVWLEVDQKIRELTKNRKSLNDFCRAFHGGAANGAEMKPYTIEEMVATLNGIAPFDWASLLRDRIYRIQPIPTMEGIKQSGWSVEYSSEPNQSIQMAEERWRQIILISSIGLRLSEDGAVADLVPGSAADRAGLTPGAKILFVNGRKFDPGRFRQAVAATLGGPPLELTYEIHQLQKTARLDYALGLLYPHLAPIKGLPDRLKDVLRPLAKTD